MPLVAICPLVDVDNNADSLVVIDVKFWILGDFSYEKDTYRVFFLNWLPLPHASLNGALVHGLAMHEEEGGGAEALKKTPCIMHICML